MYALAATVALQTVLRLREKRCAKCSKHRPPGRHLRQILAPFDIEMKL